MRPSHLGEVVRSRPTMPVKGGISSTFLAFLTALTVIVSPALMAQPAGAAAGATLVVMAPKKADLGAPFDVTLQLAQSRDVAAFESSVLFDPSAAEFDQLDTSSNSVKALGRDVGQLSAVETPYGAAIGFYSCPVTDCLNNQSPRHNGGASGNVTLATVTLIGDQPGNLNVTFDSAKAVDSNGNPISLNVPNSSITVQIGASVTGSNPNHNIPSPQGRWKLPSAGSVKAGPFSTTGSGIVANADVMEVAMAWQNLREHGNACGTAVEPRLDVNHDGCIDVADVQSVAANYSTTATPATSSSSGDLSSASTNTASLATTGSTFVVNSTGDQDDANKGDGICRTSVGTCTLRAAIAESNKTSGPNTINFDIAGSGVQTIHVYSSLPSLWDTSGPTTIDGYTQPGSSVNTSSLADNAQIMIQVEGGGENQYDALPITSSGNLIRGLAFYNFERSFWIYGSGGKNNLVVGCFVGTNAAGTFGFSSGSSTPAHGIMIEKGAAANTVGRPNLADRNVISGNGRSGVGIWHGGTNAIIVQNNIIGLSPDGTRRVPNQKHGVDMNYGTRNDVIGGTGQNERNVVSGNSFDGIDVSHTSGTTLNQVVGNFIGTSLSGMSSPSYAYNGNQGIRVEDGVQYNTISDNVIGGSSNHSSDCNCGILILNSTTNHNTITRNRIGVSLNGTSMPNGTGMVVYGVNNTIGPDNIVAHNLKAGVEVQTGATGNTITQNSMFSNGGPGIQLDSGGNNNLASPTINSVSTTSATGSACGGCTVEIFIADSGLGVRGEGQTFVGSGAADSGGSFSVSLNSVSSGDFITATATDSSGNTSGFSLNAQVPGTANLPGHIEAENYNPGGQSVGYFDTTSGNTGGAYRNDDVDIQTCSDPSTPSGQACFDVGWIGSGEWLAFTVNVTTAGNYTFALRVASPYSGKQMHIELDGNNVSGAITAPNTGGWQTWKNVTTSPIALPSGQHVLKLVFDTGQMNVNYFDVSSS